MAGIIRWRDLQNIDTTETEINLLYGLIVDGPQINRLNGFTGNGTDLNLVSAMASSYADHIASEITKAHPILPGSIDGGALATGTVSKTKLDFTALDLADKILFENSFNQIDIDISQLETQVNNLYGVLFPETTGDIAEQFAQLVAHIQKLEDAHDATAISYGNQYSLSTNSLAGSTQAFFSLSDIREFRIGDEIEFKDSNSGPESRVLASVDYNNGQISWSIPLTQDYKTTNSAIAKNLTTANVEQTLARSLRNNTDVFTGRLTINQSSDNDALVITKTGTGYTANFNTFIAKTQNWSVELGANNGSSFWEVLNSDKRIAAQITDNGQAWLNTIDLEDRTSLFAGQITKQSLSADRTWTIPNRSGFVGLGDLTFTEFLKVNLITGTKQLTIAPGSGLDYSGQKVGAWISMEKPSDYPGATINIETKFASDAQLLSLGSQWQVFVIYISDQDSLNFFYGPKEATRADAISEYINFIPSAFMKLAKIVIQGDGLGGILQSSIEILEDQRPFLTMGMSASYYDESLTSATGWASGTLITLPPNAKAGGLIQTYKIGRGQLEVYLDGAYQEVGVDYEESQGEPVGRIRVLKNIAPNSRLKFRITFAAAAVTGGFEVSTLQSAYLAGPAVSINEVNGPIHLFSYDTDLLMNIEGSVNLTNKIYNLKSLAFQQSNVTTDSTINQIFVNTNADLIFHQYKTGVAKDYNILTEIDDSKTLTRMTMLNASGATIPKGRAVALHPSLPNAFILCDTSSDSPAARCIGVTLTSINFGDYGDIVVSGLFKTTGLSIAHNTVVIVDPRNPGLIVPRNSVNFLPNDEYVEVGLINSSDLIVNLFKLPKAKNVWKIGVAGESFNANQTVLVRFAVDGETRGSVYKADKSLANIDQKFWVVAAVKPTIAVSAGDPIELFKIIEMHSTEVAFDDQDMGKPLYLDSNGAFKSWRLLNGTFTVGDAAIKIGTIEDRRKFIIDGIQMMGTAPSLFFE